MTVLAFLPPLYLAAGAACVGRARWHVQGRATFADYLGPVAVMALLLPPLCLWRRLDPGRVTIAIICED